MADSNIGNSKVRIQIAYTHTFISLLWITLSPCFFSFSSFPSSCLYPEITAFPLGRQAVEGTFMDVFSLLSNERRNVTVGLSTGPSQPSISTCGISSVHQTAGRQLCSRFSFLSRHPSLYLPQSLCISTVCLFPITSKQRPRSASPVRLSQPAPHPTPLT